MVKRNLNRRIYRENKKKRRIFFVFKFLAISLFFLVFFLVGVFVFYAKDLPRPEKFTEKQFIQSTKVYDRTGEILLYEIYGEEKRTLISLEKVPELLKEAVIVTEDVNFYHHFGIDFNGIIRSVLINLKIKEPIYGGSTIPQQLIRSTFFSTEKTMERKIREIVLALELDRRYSKEQILEWYLNQVPFGSNSYGVEAASQTYFEKSVTDLSLPEIATLASLIQAPSYLSPYGQNKGKLLERKDYVLERMAEEGFLTEEEAERAKQEDLKFSEKAVQIKAPYFTLWVKQLIEEEYDEEFLRKEGLKIYTSLDWKMQEVAEKTVSEGIERNKIYNAYNAGLVAIDPRNGEVLAMTVGTGDYYSPSFPEGCISGKNCLFDPQFNVVIGTETSPGRQPGSAFKPFIYATAFKNGFDDKTTLIDAETNFGVWGGKEYIPQNYDGLFRGEVSLRTALSQSLNIPSIKVLYLAGTEGGENIPKTNNFAGKENVFFEGLKNSIETAREMGITTLNKPLSSYGPAIVLGGGEVKLIEITSSFGVFAAEGLQVPPVPILRIEDSQGNVLRENVKTPKRVLPKETARLINDILSDNEARAPMFGSRSALYFENYQVAAKTGTTQDYRDAWTIGYTPSISVGVWAGNSNNDPMFKKPGVTLAGPIFHNFLEEILPSLPKEEFAKPENQSETNQP
jgi:membrane peptidoglycan carboxypeptidase